MPSQYVPVKDITHRHRKRSILVRLVRTYEIPEVRGSKLSKSKECLFYDVEVIEIEFYSPKDKVIIGFPTQLVDFLIEDSK
nr:replication protein A 70 kDa DNA-binding subunit A-like [Ipomoea batatas]